MTTTTTTRPRCACGKAMSKYATECKACYAKRSAENYAKVQAVVDTGKCPTCGAPLRRNLSLTGWWQCSQLGAEGFRADSSKQPCSWQGFTAR